MLLSVIALWGCGGGGGESPPTDDAAVGGIWEGTVDIQGEGVTAVFAFVTEAGEAHFVQEDGVQYWGTLSTSQRELSGALSAATPFGATFPDGSTGATGSVGGTIVPYLSIRATLSLTTGAGSAASGEMSLRFDRAYGQGWSVANLAGTFTDAAEPGSDSLTLDSNGVLFGQDPSTSCVVNGQLRRLNIPHNVYNVSLTYSSCAGDYSVLNGTAFSGLGAVYFDSSIVRLVVGLGGTASGVPMSILWVYERT